jgi:adenylate cyclase
LADRLRSPARAARRCAPLPHAWLAAICFKPQRYNPASPHGFLLMALFVDDVKLYLANVWQGLARSKRLPFYLGLLTTLLVFALHVTKQPIVRELLTRLDLLIYDLRFKVVPSELRTNELRNNEHNIVIVDYDQRSLEAEGQWPWSRFKLAELTSKLASAGAVVVGFDVFFPEPERNPLNELQQRIQQNTQKSSPDVNAQAQALLPQLAAVSSLLDADAYFARVMQSANTSVVLGFSFLNEGKQQDGSLPKPIFRLDANQNAAIALHAMQGYTGNVETLQQAASGAGFFDTMPDVDGVIRHYNLVLRYQDNIYPSLALEMARLYYLAEEFSAQVERDAQGLDPQLTGILMGQIAIPTDAKGRVTIPYQGRSGSFPYLSATNVLRGTLTPAQQQQLQNSVVLVGTTATGLYDLRSMPLQAVYPGVEIHATVLNAILNSTSMTVVDGKNPQPVQQQGLFTLFDKARMSPFPTRPYEEQGIIAVTILVLGVSLSLLYPYLGPARLALASMVLMAGFTALNFYLWRHYRLDFSLLLVLLLILLITIVNMTYGFMKEGINKKVLKDMFGLYVPPAHIDEMLNEPDKYSFSGESRELSVLFADIRNFTSTAEKLKATELKVLLNEFFTPITAVIFEHNGTIDKYVGDMVMAFWGAPLRDAQHRNNAVNAALTLLAKVEELKPLFKAKGLPMVEVGIGINSGLMNVGDMGSAYRRAYTVIGDAVNLGSRLQSLTKVYGVKLLIGETTYEGLQGVLCRLIDKVQVKGRQESIRIYEPLCLEAEASEALKTAVIDYHAAYQRYLYQRWDEAAAAFQQLLSTEPECTLSKLYLERIAYLRQQELPAEWDGSYQHSTK